MPEETTAPVIETAATVESTPPNQNDEPVSDWVDPAHEEEVKTETSAEEAQADNAAEGSESVTEKEEPVPEKEKKSGVQKRLDEITKKRREAEREAKYWRDKAEGRDNTKSDTETPPTDKRPRDEDFSTYEEYEDALDDYNDARRKKVEAKLKAEAASTQVTESKREAIDISVKKGQELYADFNEVTSAPGLAITETMVDIALEGESPHDVFYYLATNAEEAEEIAGMSMINASKAIGKIESKLSKEKAAKKTPEPNKITKAPAPIKPIGGKEVVKKDPNNMTMDEYADWANGGYK